jgi:hypothetical protein
MRRLIMHFVTFPSVQGCSPLSEALQGVLL